MGSIWEEEKKHTAFMVDLIPRKAPGEQNLKIGQIADSTPILAETIDS